MKRPAKNAQKYDQPMSISKVFRVTPAMDEAWREQCEARDLDQSEVLRAFLMRYAGVK